MRKLLLIASLLFTAVTGVFAQSDAIYIYRNDGLFNGFMKEDIDSMAYSHYDADSVYHDDWQMQVIYTPDSIYQIPLAAIDSISFIAPETKVKSGVMFFTEDYIPYTISHTDNSVAFLSSLPDEMRPKVGQVVASATVTAPFDFGFSGRVTDIVDKGDSIIYNVEAVSISDIYDRIVAVGKLYNEAAEAKARGIKKIGDGQNHTFTIPFPSSISLGVGPFSLSVETEITCTYNIFWEPGFEPVASVQIKHVHECEGSIKTGKDFEPFDETAYGAAVPVNTGIPGCYGTFKMGPFLSVTGSVDVNVKLPFTVTGYSGFYMNGVNFKTLDNLRCKLGKPDWSIDMEGSIFDGMDFRLTFNVVHEKFASAWLRARVGPKVSASFSLDGNDLMDSGLYTALKDSKMDFCANVNIASGYRLVGGDDKEFASVDISVFNQELYFLPEFPDFDCTADEDNKSINASTRLERSLVVPVKAGFCLYDEDLIKEKWFHEKTYWFDDISIPQPMTYDFEGLTAGKTYKIHPIISIFGNEMLADDEVAVTLAPDIATLSANQEQTSLTFVGKVDGSTYSENVNVGFLYGTSPDLQLGNCQYVERAETGDGEFYAQVDKLSLGKTYYYCAVAIIDGTAYYGEVQSATIDFDVSTMGASEITKNSAYLSGYLSVIPTDDFTAYGISFKNGTSESNNRVTNIRDNGTYGFGVSELSPETTYSYRAYCCVDGKYYYGEWKTFTTEKDDDDDDDDDPDDPTDDPVTDELSPSEQKTRLDKIAKDLMNAIPASDFEPLGKLANYAKYHYGSEDYWESVGDWQLACYKSLRTFLGQNKDSETYYYTSDDVVWTDVYTDIVDNYKALIYASNFKSRFTAGESGWVRSDADDLEFIFNDAEGKECVARLTTSGDCVKAYWGECDYNTDHENIQDGTTTYCNYYYDAASLTIGVPEKLEFTLTDDGQTLLKFNADFDLKDMTSSDNFDLSTSNLSFAATIDFGNGYVIDINNVRYNANSDVLVSMNMTKKDKSLISVYVSSNVKNIPSANLSSILRGDYDDDSNPFDNNRIDGDGVFKVDVMGELQVEGEFSNARKAIDALEDCGDDYEDYLKFNGDIQDVNSCYNAYMYYDNTSIKQASITFETFGEEQWDGDIEYYAEPVFNFTDGSSYSAFSAFFNDNDFRSLINTFKTFANSYSSYVDEEIYGDE